MPNNATTCLVHLGHRAEKSLTAQDVLLAGGVSLGMPLLLTGPLFPSRLGAPIPTSVALDLSGCIGCMSLINRSAHLYIYDLHLIGLERPVGSSSSSSGDGTQLSLPLWAFHFNRSSGSPSVTLHNVTLTLPQEEFRLLLAGLPAGPGPAAAAGQFSVLGGLQLMVSGAQRLLLTQKKHRPYESHLATQYPPYPYESYLATQYPPYPGLGTT